MHSPKGPFTPSSRQPRNAFVNGNIHGVPVDILVDTGACISVIDAEFVKKFVCEKSPSIMVPSTYSEVDTVSGEKISTVVGQIKVALSFNSKEFPCQFHVIPNMTCNAVLGRDFLLANDAVINFAKGILTLDSNHPMRLSLEANSRPMTSLIVQNSQSTTRYNKKQSAATLSKLLRNSAHFVQQCKKASIFFLKFLIILLLMSPHCRADMTNDYEFSTSKDNGIFSTERTNSRPSILHSESMSPNTQGNPYLSPQFSLHVTHLRLKDS